jgi:XTP/dITP diphosphohydrolase
MKLIFASKNTHKLEEIRFLLKSYEIISLDDVGCKEEVPETSDTIQGNALQKARQIYNTYKINCFADDTGLEVYALGGEPGVLSARYAGEQKSSVDNIQKVLLKLGDSDNRKARFITIIALIIDGKEYIFEGIIEGEISKNLMGNNGFGYDPIFVPQGFSKSFAEMSFAEKNECSHRVIAIKKLVNFLKNKTSLTHSI